MTVEHKLTVETVDIDSIFPHPKNANIGNVDAIKESIETNGVYRPVVVSRLSKRILAGNHTYKAMRELKYRAIDVVFLDGLTPDDEIRIMLADNRVAQLGSMDVVGMVELLDVLRESSDLTGTGWDDAAYDAMVASLQPEQDDLPKEPEDLEPPEYTVVVSCDDAQHQLVVLEQVRELGFTAKPVIK